VTAATTAAAIARHPLDEEFVLRDRPLRPGQALHDTARFDDLRWPLRPAMLQCSQKALTLNFAAIPVRYRSTAKELCFAMLTGTLPPGERRPALATIHAILIGVTPFLAWLDAYAPQPGGPTGPALADLTGPDLEAYQRHLLLVAPGSTTRDIRRGAVRHFWRYRNSMITDRLPFDPLHVEGWTERRRHGPAENATDRIPEAVHGPLLAWALRFVDDFAEDILLAVKQRSALRGTEQRRPLGRPPGTNTGVGQALRALLNQYLAHRRPLPGRHGNVNILFLATTLACATTSVERYRAEIEAVAAQVGISDRSYFDITITGQLDGQPWIDGIATDHTFNNAVATLARMLQAAGYIAVAFLSGMRDPEIKHLRRGCLHGQRDSAGRTYRWKVTSLAFKGENDPAGVPATWLVGAPAARAIKVLQRLQPADTDLLFARLPHSPGSKSNDTTEALSSSGTNHQLTSFVQWVNNYCAAHGRHDGIPLVNGQPWRLSVRQFRRTLAWFIARRPGGAIAGAIAYRHLSIQMFEGYAGTSDSGFRAEVESEQALARGEHLLAMANLHEHTNLAGPAAEEAARRIEEFGDQARFPGSIVLDERRLARVMQRNDPAVYPGKYVTCVHKHETALCQQRRDTRGELRPDLGNCQPLACRNVALTADNIATWRDEIQQIDRDLAQRPLLPPLLSQQLGARRDEITTFLNQHTQDHP
jgi:hypothetical protein